MIKIYPCKAKEGGNRIMNRIIAFAIFWVAIGMLLMLCFRYRVMGTLSALALLGVSYLVLMCGDD